MVKKQSFMRVYKQWWEMKKNYNRVKKNFWRTQFLYQNPENRLSLEE